MQIIMQPSHRSHYTITPGGAVLVCDPGNKFVTPKRVQSPDFDNIFDPQHTALKRMPTSRCSFGLMYVAPCPRLATGWNPIPPPPKTRQDPLLRPPPPPPRVFNG